MGALKLISVTLIALCLTTACSVSTKGSFCALATPQRPSKEAIEKLSDEQVAALLRHNRLGGKLCGWKQ